jgi:hypothetical protein
MRRFLSSLNWGVIGALLFSLLAWYALFGAITSAAAQEPVSLRDGAQIQQIYPGEGVRGLWDQVVACAGDSRDTSKTFEQITFMLRDSLASDAPGVTTAGEWNADTVFITKGYQRDGWVVAHELLHHALNGPPTGNPHPLTPFQFPCGLYTHPTDEKK